MTSPAPAPGRTRGAWTVWALEVGKLIRQRRVQAVAVLCVVVPFLSAGAVEVQSAVPADTLFGQWIHESGFALPMVIVGFCGQWVFPALAALVAGDVFSAEDHHGTWKLVLTRSCTRGEIFVGKVFAAVSYSVVMLVLLAGASLVAGLTLGAHPVVGLGGQLVPNGRAVSLVALSWALQIPPLLGFAALAVLLSVGARNSVVGIGGPILVGLVMQLLTLIDLGVVRLGLLATPFVAWHGLWVPHPFYGPIWHGLITSAAWAIVCLVAAWGVFRTRSVRLS